MDNNNIDLPMVTPPSRMTLEQLDTEVYSAWFHHDRVTSLKAIGDAEHRLLTYWGKRYHNAVMQWEARTGTSHPSRRGVQEGHTR